MAETEVVSQLLTNATNTNFLANAGAASMLAAGLSIGLAAIGAGIGMSSIGKVFEGIARQPDAEPILVRNMFIALAFMEALAIYGLVIAFILLYANPLLKMLG